MVSTTAELPKLSAETEHLHTWENVCRSHCHMDGDAHMHNALGAGCNSYKFMMPRPKVYRHCRDAFQEGLQISCNAFCKEKSATSSFAEHHAGQWCKKYRRELPKPGVFNACEAGFMAAFEGAKHFASRKKAEWHEKRAAGEIPAQAEIEMEEEATIEEKIVKAMPIEKKVDEKKIHEHTMAITRGISMQTVAASTATASTALTHRASSK